MFSTLVLIHFGRPRLGHTIKINFIQLIQTADPEIFSILIFYKKGLGLVSPPHLVYDFSGKYFSYYILLTEKISLSGCLHFWRYWAIGIL